MMIDSDPNSKKQDLSDYDVSDLSKESLEEIKIFLKEKERIRKLIGAIGGKAKKYDKFINISFAIIVVGVFIGALLLHGVKRLISIEVGVLLISLKLIYFLHNEAKVNHFQFWILSTLEWKIGELDTKLNRIEKLLKRNEKEKD